MPALYPVSTVLYGVSELQIVVARRRNLIAFSRWRGPAERYLELEWIQEGGSKQWKVMIASTNKLQHNFVGKYSWSPSAQSLILREEEKESAPSSSEEYRFEWVTEIERAMREWQKRNEENEVMLGRFRLPRIVNWFYSSIFRQMNRFWVRNQSFLFEKRYFSNKSWHTISNFCESTHH